MARSRSPLAVVFAAVFAALVCRLAFVPAPGVAPRMEGSATLQQAAQAGVLSAIAAPMPVLALEDDDEGFDIRIIAVLALPLLAISW
eukprot:CAMPEP_0170622456 /NCGR_PEP_ID=MMETSP0224-20130122/29141_1 /TAXON_ID=285029 /ORGANISM="Togula jolla, Strain CCCM 725" /LENGTH=86 /DNA_ID=CAMNT_0010948777 /DNA_START=50 /DNA_END=307 /DNA_ORIENTATION=+